MAGKKIVKKEREVVALGLELFDYQLAVDRFGLCHACPRCFLISRTDLYPADQGT